MNDSIKINAGVSIDNAIACIKRDDKDLAIRFLQNAKEILACLEDDEAVLNNFSRASRDRAGDLISDWSDQEQDVQSEMLVKHGHEAAEFGC